MKKDSSPRNSAPRNRAVNTEELGKPYSRSELHALMNRLLRGEDLNYRNPHSLGNFIGCLH